MNIAIQHLLLADLFEAIVPILLVAFWVLRQVMEAKRGADQPVEEVDEAPAGQEPVRSEVDDFLRKLGKEPKPEEPGDDVAEERRRLRERQQSSGSDDTRRIAREEKRREEQDRKKQRRAEADQAQQARTTRTSRRRVEMLFDEEAEREPQMRKPQSGRPSERSSADVSSRHLSHLKESQLAEQAAHLGEDIAQADERLEARLHSKFDHRLGNLSSSADQQKKTPDEPKTPSSAESIAAMLKTPAGMRNAVILNEILRRPYE